MKKTYNINISGYGFVIDEDAYDVLHSYLTTLSEICDKGGEKETALDIECRIAEIFTENHSKRGPYIISITDVEEVIGRMGSPEEIIDLEVAESTGHCVPPQLPPQIKEPVFIPKRLYRDVDNKIIGGVCSGLACYLGVDPTWMRILAIVGLFLSASWVAFVYILLWIVIPPAVTPFEKIQMTGVDPSIRNIGKIVTGQYDIKSISSTPPPIPTDPKSAGGLGGVAKVLVILSLIFIGSILVATTIAFVFSFVALCLSPIGGFNENMNYVRLVLGFIMGLAIVVSMPLIMLFKYLLSSFTGREQCAFKRTQNNFILIVWLLGAAVTLTCWCLL